MRLQNLVKSLIEEADQQNIISSSNIPAGLSTVPLVVAPIVSDSTTTSSAVENVATTINLQPISASSIPAHMPWSVPYQFMAPSEQNTSGVPPAFPPSIHSGGNSFRQKPAPPGGYPSLARPKSHGSSSSLLSSSTSAAGSAEGGSWTIRQVSSQGCSRVFIIKGS